MANSKTTLKASFSNDLSFQTTTRNEMQGKEDGENETVILNELHFIPSFDNIKASTTTEVFQETTSPSNVNINNMAKMVRGTKIALDS